MLSFVAATSALRIVTVGVSFLTNIICIKVLSLSEAGNLYSIISIAYFGNALFFIGFDFATQRKLKDISHTKELNLVSVLIELKKILGYGSLSTLILSLLILPNGSIFTKIEISLLAASFSSLNFLLTFFRNILLVAGKKTCVTCSLLIEQILKFLLTIVAVSIFGKSSIAIFLAFIACSLATAYINYKYVIYSIRASDADHDYSLTKQEVFHTLLPVSGSGVLNWIQLQAYRPVLVRTYPDTTIVGSVSFLTSLGGAVASAIFGILAQFWIPKQFASSGRSSKRFFYIALSATLALALLSYPTAFMFLRLLHKPSLNGLEILVPIGIMIEGGSFMLGILGNHSSLVIRTFVPSMISGLLGAIVSFCSIYFLSVNFHLNAINLGIALAISQLFALGTLLPVLKLQPLDTI